MALKEPGGFKEVTGRVLRFARFVFVQAEASRISRTKVQIFMDNLFCIKTIQAGPDAILCHYGRGFGDGARNNHGAAGNHRDVDVLNLRQ